MLTKYLKSVTFRGGLNRIKIDADRSLKCKDVRTMSYHKNIQTNVEIVGVSTKVHLYVQKNVETGWVANNISFSIRERKFPKMSAPRLGQDCPAAVLGAGGKPSTRFPPGRLVELG